MVRMFLGLHFFQASNVRKSKGFADEGSSTMHHSVGQEFPVKVGRKVCSTTAVRKTGSSQHIKSEMTKRKGKKYMMLRIRSVYFPEIPRWCFLKLMHYVQQCLKPHFAIKAGHGLDDLYRVWSVSYIRFKKWMFVACTHAILGMRVAFYSRHPKRWLLLKGWCNKQHPKDIEINQ